MYINHKELSEKGLDAINELITWYPNGSPCYPLVKNIPGMSADDSLKEHLINRQKTSSYPPESENRRRWARALKILDAYYDE